MAPPKTMAISQQQQSMTQVDQPANKQAKPRKRKAKQQQQQQQQQHNQQQQPVAQVNPASTGDQQLNNKQLTKPSLNGQEKIAHVKEAIDDSKKPNNFIVPCERTTINKKQQNREPTKVIAPQVESKRLISVIAEVSPATVITKHHQLTAEEADDVDAGIELDGSSNSGSSVKDINEDQLKSTSVSPVMAQSSLIINESCAASAKQPAEVSSVDQLTSSLCSAVPAKKISTTKQQLAANQQVIDADEQLLQEKLQNKQRKSSIPQELDSSATNEQLAGDKKALNTRTGNDKSAKVRRSFSSQSSQEENSLCKVCDQHVYQMERMLAEKSIYHKRCFRCYQCKIQLRVDNYSSHEGQVYCKAHHRQIFQPQVKLDSEEDVDIVAKSTKQRVDDYLLHRGRLSELSFSFLQQNPEGIRKRQMIICENEPTELPKDVVRSDTKLDDGIQQLNLNLNNILEKFERGTAGSVDDNQPSSAGVLIDKPSVNIKQTLMAFESKLVSSPSEDQIDSSKSDKGVERPVVKKLGNLNGFFKTSIQENSYSQPPVRPLAVRRSESLMMRLKKYESRVAGEQVDEENSDEDENNNSSNKEDAVKVEVSRPGAVANAIASVENSAKDKQAPKPKKLPSIDLSSLKNQWENGDINKKRDDEDEDEQTPRTAGDKTINGNSPSIEKNEELLRIRQQLAEKKSGESGSIRNIYENAIKEAQLQSKQQALRRDSSDLSALNGFSTTGIQQQLLQNSLNGSNSNNGQNVKTPTTPNKDHFQLNLSNKANKLKEKFELGLITNSSQDDSDYSDSDDVPTMTKLEQIRQEKMEDLSIFTEGEIKAREARSIFQQMDRRISATSGGKQPKVHSRSLAAIGDSMRTKLTNQMNANSAATNHNHQIQPQEQPQQQPIRLTNNVRT